MRSRLMVSSLILFVLALSFNILFTHISLEKLYVDTIVSRYVVIAQDVKRTIERGMKYGKPVNSFIGIQSLLTKAHKKLMEQSSHDIVISGVKLPYFGNEDVSVHFFTPDKKVKYSTSNNKDTSHVSNITQLIQQSTESDTDKSSHKDYIKYEENYVILLPVLDSHNSVAAHVAIFLDEKQVKEFLENVSSKNIAPIIMISICGILLLTVLLNLMIPKDISSDNFSKKKIYLVIFLIISGAQILACGIYTNSFKEHFIIVNMSNAKNINVALKDDIEYLINKGIKTNKLRNLDLYFKKIIDDAVEIQDITFFDIHSYPLYRATKDRITDFQRSKDAYSEWIETRKPLPDPDYNSRIFVTYENKSIGYISTNTSKDIIIKRLLDVIMDSATVIVISILFFVELLILIFKYIERQVDDSKQQIPLHYGIMRPAAFLFLFGIDISVSFLPLHMETLYVPILGLSKDTVMGLPISVEFMFVGISILVSGIWLDRRGWHEPFLCGLILAALGILYSWLATNALHFIVSRGIVGLGYGLSLMASQGFVITYSDWKSKAQGLAHLFAGIYAGSICGGATGAMLAEWLGYTPVFLFGAVILIAVVVYTLVFMREGMKKPAPPAVKEKRGSTRGKPILNFVSNRTILGLVFFSSLPAAIAVVGLLNYFSPIYLKRIGASQSTIGQIMMIYGICLIYFGPFISRYVDVSRHKKIYIFLGCSLGSISLLTFYILEGYAAAVTAVLLLGLSSSFVLASQSAYTLELQVTQELGEGKAIGIFRSTSRVGQMLGPIVFSSIIVATNIRSGITYLGLAYLLTAFLFLLLTVKNGKELTLEQFRSEPSL